MRLNSLELVGILPCQEGIQQIDVLDDDPLGAPSGTGSVDHIYRVLCACKQIRIIDIRSVPGSGFPL